MRSTSRRVGSAGAAARWSGRSRLALGSAGRAVTARGAGVVSRMIKMHGMYSRNAQEDESGRPGWQSQVAVAVKVDEKVELTES